MSEFLYRRLDEIVQRRRIPDSPELEKSLVDVLKVLDDENPQIRPADEEGVPGGLLKLKELPTIIVPDLHARVDYLRALAHWQPGDLDRPVLEALQGGIVQVICVGDGFHSERRGLDRWKKALNEFLHDYKKHKAMDEEMAESLGVMQIVMEWKAAFPDHFHFLKGNHENVANENTAENRAFRKFAYEGDMVAFWFKRFLGEKLFDLYYKFEKRLPIFAVGNRFCVTHAEPRIFYPPEDIINCYRQGEIIFDHTWTDDNAAEEGSVEQLLNHYFPDDNDSLLFGGHRPVRYNYNLRANGRYVQIHNPERYVAAFITDMNDFDLEKNIQVIPAG